MTSQYLLAYSTDWAILGDHSYRRHLAGVFLFCNPGSGVPHSPIISLESTLTRLPASVHSKRLTPNLSPLESALTRNRGWVPAMVNQRSDKLRCRTITEDDEKRDGNCLKLAMQETARRDF